VRSLQPTALLLIFSLLVQAGGAFAATIPCGTDPAHGTASAKSVMHGDSHHPERHHHMADETDPANDIRSTDCCDGMKNGLCAGAGCAPGATPFVISALPLMFLNPRDATVIPRPDRQTYSGPPSSIFRPPIA
jgi:hypothetical protein